MISKKSECTQNCQTLGEATLKYNEAVAKLVILEGLIALNAGITESADAIKHITPSEITKVKDLSTEFLASFEKAKILHKVLQIKENGSYPLEGYTGDSPSLLIGHLNSTAPEIFEVLTEVKYQEEVLDALQGFSEADRKVTTLDKENTYANYRKYLSFEMNGEKLDMNAPSHQVYEDVLKINELAKKETLSNEEKKELLSKSNALQKIHVQLSHNSNVEKNIATNSLDEKIGNYLQNTQSMSSTLLKTDRQKEKLLGLKKELEHHEQAKINGLEEKLLNMQGVCESEEKAKACLSRLKGTPRFNELGLSEFNPLVAEKRQESSMEKLLGELASCYEQKSLSEIKTCQMKAMDKNEELTKTEIADARKAVVNAKNEMDKLYEDENIVSLQKEKVELYAKLQSKPECIEGTLLNKVDLSNGFCGFKELDSLVMSSGTTGEFKNILTSLERTYSADIRAEVKADVMANNNQTQTNTGSRQVSGNVDNGGQRTQRASTVVGHVQGPPISYGNDFTVTKEDYKAEQNRIKAEQRRIKELKKSKRTGPSGAEYALQGLAQVTVTSAPQLLMLHQQNQYVKSYAENYRQTMIQRQQYQQWLTQQQQFYGQLYATGNLNYGWGFYNPNNASNFNYPNNQYTFYQHGSNGFNFSQYNFLNPTTTPSFGSNNGITTTTSNPQFNFQF